VLDYLQRRRSLLVLDNFENLLEGEDLLTDIIQHAPEVQLLVTSRERLNLLGEQLYPIRGLEVAEDDDTGNYAAGELFIKTAQRVQPDFDLQEGDQAVLMRICRLAEGMPLGLELAASWVSVLPLEAIAREMERSLNFLATEFRDLPQRHRSMQAALNLSWQRLNNEQQDAIRKLSVFQGGFARMAALESRRAPAVAGDIGEQPGLRPAIRPLFSRTAAPLRREDGDAKLEFDAHEQHTVFIAAT
jgi:predicted ATPase